jgi:lipoprotein-releasing system permease protein
MSLSALPARIAMRYLRAPKSHSAVSAISIVAVVGVAVATAAIICVLSVFNGFRGILTEKLDILAPDVLVTPAQGKTFADADSVARIVGEVDGIQLVMPSVIDNALAIVGGREMPITLRGVDTEVYGMLTSVDSITMQPTRIASLSPRDALASVGVARQLGIFDTETQMLIFAPRREGRVNLSNPMASFITDSVRVADVFQALQSDYDEKTVICDINTARDLFQYDNEATSLEIQVRPGEDIQKVAAEVERKLGSGAVVKDRFRQQEINFRMISIEKWVTFLLLIFILVIASFNIISTLCMLILEKQGSMSTLSALGMNRRAIGRTFWWESLFVSLTGGLGGVALGLALCLLQQHFGLIKLGGDPDTMILQAYPVEVIWTDILIALAPVVVIGLITAWTASAFARSRIR